MNMNRYKQIQIDIDEYNYAYVNLPEGKHRQTTVAGTFPRQPGTAAHGGRVPLLPVVAAGRDGGVVQCGAEACAL